MKQSDNFIPERATNEDSTAVEMTIDAGFGATDIWLTSIDNAIAISPRNLQPQTKIDIVRALVFARDEITHTRRQVHHHRAHNIQVSALNKVIAMAFMAIDYQLCYLINNIATTAPHKSPLYKGSIRSAVRLARTEVARTHGLVRESRRSASTPAAIKRQEALRAILMRDALRALLRIYCRSASRIPVRNAMLASDDMAIKANGRNLDEILQLLEPFRSPQSAKYAPPPAHLK